MTTTETHRAPAWVRNPRDLVGGLVMIGIALFAFWASSDLPGMRGFQLGAGAAPRLLAGLLLGIGVVIAVLAFVRNGPGLPKFGWRGALVVTGSLLLFAVAVRPLGLLPSTFIMFLVASLASSETRWIEAFIAAIGLTVLIYLVFIVALGIPFQPWPRFIGQS